jgi:hypothetical protein
MLRRLPIAVLVGVRSSPMDLICLVAPRRPLCCRAARYHFFTTADWVECYFRYGRSGFKSLLLYIHGTFIARRLSQVCTSITDNFPAQVLHQQGGNRSRASVKSVWS